MANEKTRFPVGRICILSFVVVTFVLPGIWGAIVRSSPPTPWQMGGTWATWIAGYAGVFVFAYAVTKLVLCLLERREHR
jgi:hypothetical protein